MAPTRRLKELLGEVSSVATFPDGEQVTVALSGGADSAALALIATELERSVSLLHINHGFAGSTAMEEAAGTVAECLDLTLDIVKVEVEEGPSVEGQARNARYRAFGHRAVEVPILTGHTLDDQAETVLLNMLRGAGVRGISGIPPFRPPNVYRPLLNVTRSRTREIALLANLGFVDDPMNLDPTLRRNSIRLQTLPSLQRYNIRLSDALARLAESARLDNEYLDRETGQIPLVVGQDRASVVLGDLVPRDPVIGSRALSELIRRLRGSGPTADELDRIWAVVRSEVDSTEIGGRFVVGREGSLLVIVRSVDSTPVGPVALTAGVHRVGRYHVDVFEFDEPCRVAPIGAGSAVFPAGTELIAEESASGDVVVAADGRTAWEIGRKRHPIAFYEGGASGYLSVIATEETYEWISNP
ncbi:MAG: tRNA lysidine(34) synthetase TilS [Acidimicrobiia bacterium]